jgi:signal transduction histidine kinase/ActR/RegA family two-component response regulator
MSNALQDAPASRHDTPARPRLNLARLDVRIGLALGSLMLVLALVLAYVLSMAAERQILRLSAGNLESLSDQMARELADGMDRFARDVQTESVRETFRTPEGSPSSMRAALDQFKAINPEFAWAAVVDASNGRVIAATQGLFEGGSIRDRPVFTQGLKGAFVGDAHEAVRLGELMPKTEDGEPRRFLDVSAPIRDGSGKVTRVLAAHIAWQWTGDLRARIFGPLRARRGVEAFLVDTQGKVVLAGGSSTPTGANLATVSERVGQPTARLVWDDGRDYLTYVVATNPQGQFRGFGWKVVTRQPFEAAFGLVRRLQWAFFAGAVVLGLLAAFLAWWISAMLVRPVRKLADLALRAADDASLSSIMADESLEEVSAVRGLMQKLSHVARTQTEEKESSVRQFAALAHSLPQVVWQADIAGVVRYVNKDWISPTPGHAFDAATMARLVVDEDRSTFIAAWSGSIETGADLDVRCRLKLLDAEDPRWCDMKASLAGPRGDSTSRWIGTIFDVHELVIRAQQMERTLQDERRAKEELERLIKQRDQFLRMVSHELRSPLSAISGWSEILLKKSAADPLVLQAATVIRRNAQLQNGLINDLLDMNAVTAGRLVLDRAAVDLADIARDTVDALHAEAQRRGVALEYTGQSDLRVNGDGKRLAQIIANLVGNALKFTESGGRVDVTSRGLGDVVVVKVVDTGCGISPQFISKVFEGLQQEDASTTRRKGGLGVGLAMAKGLTELHGGSISAISAGVDQGSTFEVAFPALAQGASLPSAKKLQDEGSSDSLAGLRVLLVDDEDDAREVAEVALTTLGAHVRAVASGAEVLALLGAEHFDILVSDIGMPEFDGIALISEIRTRFRSIAGDLPAVALTAFAMEADRQVALAAGFDDYVAKPISLTTLAGAIGRALTKRVSQGV